MRQVAVTAGAWVVLAALEFALDLAYAPLRCRRAAELRAARRFAEVVARHESELDPKFAAEVEFFLSPGWQRAYALGEIGGDL